jgi:hypothetical protein
MTIQYRLVIAATALVLSMRAGHAGPCAEAIDRMQAELDARIAAVIDTARFARDARGAFGLPVPTQNAPATAERRSDGSWMGQAVAAMARAREADRNGDSVLCERALAETQRAIGR